MATLGSVMVQVGADLKSFDRSMKQVERTMQQTGKQLGQVGDDISKGLSDSFEDIGKTVGSTGKRFNEFGDEIKRTHGISAKNLKNLPEHLKPFADEIHNTSRELQHLSKNGANNLDALRDSVLSTRVGFDKLTSVSSKGKKVTAMLQDMQEETNKAKLAVLGFNEDATMKISTEETQARLIGFRKSIDSTRRSLEEMRDAGDIAGYTAGMKNLAFMTRDVDRAMMGAAKGGDAYLGILERMGIMTEAVADRAAINMERMRDGFFRANERMQGMATQSSKVIKNLDRMDTRGLDQQILKVADRLETMAKRGTAANLAIKELGKNASMKDLLDQVRLINTGLMRMQSLQMGMGIGVIAYTVGMVKLSNAVDGRLIPAFEKFKETWKKALTPIAKAFTDVAVVIINIGTKVGELVGKFTEANPVLSGLIGNIIYLTSVLMILLAPLAIGIGAAGAFAAAFTALWAIIGPFVTGFLAVVGTAFLVAAALTAVTYSVIKLWENSENLRNAMAGIWTSIKIAVLNAVQPIQEKWAELKVAIAGLVTTVLGEGGKMSDFWRKLGDIIAIVINTVRPLIATVLSSAFQILSAIVVPIISGLIAAFNWLAQVWQNNSGKIMNVVSLLWAFITVAFSAVNSFISGIMPSIVGIITSGFALAKQVVATVMPIIQKIATAVWPVIQKIIAVLFPIIVGIIRGAWENIKNIIRSAVAIIQNIIQLFSNILKGDWKKAWDNVKNIVKNAATLVWNLVQLYFVGKLLRVFKSFGGKVGSALSNLKDKILTPFKNGAAKASAAANKLKTDTVNKMQSMKSGISSKLSSLKSVITKPFTSAWNTIKSIPGKIKSAFSSMKISIPKFKMPSVSVGSKSFMDGKVKVPTFKVNWNAKGNIFQGASILGGGQGVGEAGTEAVMPIGRKRLFAPWAGMVAELLADNFEAGGGNGGVSNTFEIAQLVVREEADVQRIADALEKKQRQQQRAKGGYSYA